jgi:YcaO-like protein with predicted kinase domain
MEYKDDTPSSSINKAMKILSEFGIEVKSREYSYGEQLFSMKMYCESLGFAVNGKGISREYCLASACGEAIERITNMHLNDRFFENLDEKAKTYKGFHYYPDEVMLDIAQVLENQDITRDILATMEESDGQITDDENALREIWDQYIDINNQCVCVPFYNIKCQEVQYLPFEIIKRICRSNGMAAGNSPEEALCQAISEICERHVQEIVLRNKLSLPNIPIDIIAQKAEDMSELICNMTSNNEMRILVKDASLGEGFPVVCVILIDMKCQRYRIKFGSHPVFRIALERCLSEMAQGNTFSPEDNELLMTNWNHYNQENVDTLYNWGITHRRNEGNIPNELFISSNEPIKLWNEIENYTNLKGVQYLIDLFMNMGKNIYIRDNSCLGFYSYRVYIPDVSTTYKFYPLGRNTKKMEIYKKKLNRSEDFIFLNSEEKKELLDILEQDHIYGLTENIKVTENVLKAALAFDLKMYEKAKQYLLNEEKLSIYMKVVLREIELLIQGIDKDIRNQLLRLFFDEKYVLYLEMNWRDTDVTAFIQDPFRRKDISGRNARGISVEACSGVFCKVKDYLDVIDQREIQKIYKK